ncbi:MAG: ABC transporter permease, partial [Ruminiclostridium sp.]
EKTSRVIEYLLTSVKPLAIIMGKILAMCTVSLLQFIVIMIGGAAGVLISLPFGILSKVGQLTAMAATSEQAAEAGAVVSEFSSAFSSFNFGSIIFMLIVFVLGFLFFATVAGLAGASISKMEDLSSASQPLSLLGVVGFYLAYFPTIGAVTGETNIMMIISRYLPISSPFALPSAVLLNQMSVVEAIISVLILLASVIVMLMVVAKVYEAIILHNGNRLKLSDMFAMAKSK